MEAMARGGEPPRVVMVAPKHAANVGAAARAAANFGLGTLWLVAPRCSLDKEAYALAAHAGHVLDAAVTVATLDEALADRELAVATSARRRRHHGHASADPEDVLFEMVGRRSALVFGPEESGLDNDALDRCQRVVTVPTAGHASINLAQTVVVLGYVWHRTATGRAPSAAAPPAPAEGATGGEVAAGGTSSTARPSPEARAPREALAPRAERAPLAERAQVEAMLGQLRALMRRIGYTDAARETAVLRRYRSLLTRSDPDADEVTLLRGLWYQFAWAVEQVPGRLPGPLLRGWEDAPAQGNARGRDGVESAEVAPDADRASDADGAPVDAEPPEVC
jgi:TrmH family RNA methyltransferase